MPSLNFTGAWAADDGAIYYIRHLGDNSIWWAGLHNSGFHLGVVFTNVFRGVFNPTNRAIEGTWADVPRGWGILQQGRLSLDVVEIAPPDDEGLPPPPPGVPRGQTTTRIELRQKPEGTTGGFGGRVWTRWFPLDPQDTNGLFGRVRRDGGGNPLSDEIHPYKDFVVVHGWVGALGEGYGIGWLPTMPKDYCLFLTPPAFRGGGGDGDTTFNLFLDRQDRNELDSQPGFWAESSGWLRSAADIQKRLDQFNRFHTELVMFGREEDLGECRNSRGGLLSGWAEERGNSVLVNGIPINGNAFVDSDGVIYFVLSSPEVPGGQIPKRLEPRSRVRITGVIALDEGHDDLLEIHPVYALDLLQGFGQRSPNADLIGVWHADDVGTYYLRQLGGDTLWWLGLSRDQGRTFANVFHGTIQGNTIRGEWVDIPVGVSGARSAGRLTIVGGESSQLATILTAIERTGGFGGSIWHKLYDRPFTLTD